MTTLTDIQIDLLRQAAEPDGAPKPQDQQPVVKALMKMRLLIIVPRADGARMMITEAGRLAIGAPSAKSEPPARKSKAATQSARRETKAPKQRGGGKIDSLLALLRRPEGARIEELTAATGWQPHSVRGAMSGAIKKKLGVAITSEKVDGVRVYRVEGAAA